MPGTSADLYEQDFFRWTEEQAAALRQAAHSGINVPVDWENAAEEIEGLGISLKRELRSRLTVVLEHLLKLEHSPAQDPRSGWIETIARERMEIEYLLEDSPSLKGQVGALIAQAGQRAAREVARTLHGRGETGPHIAPPAYTEEQVLGDWFPEPRNPEPGPTRQRRVSRGGGATTRGAS
jgi:hypothetical protein